MEHISAIKVLRTKAGMQQQELATKSGVSGGMISQIESGKVKLSRDVATKLARVLKQTPDELMQSEQAVRTIRAIAELSNLTDEQVREFLVTAGGFSAVAEVIDNGVQVLDRAAKNGNLSSLRPVQQEMERVLKVMKSVVKPSADNDHETYTDVSGNAFYRDASGRSKRVAPSVKNESAAGGEPIWHDVHDNAFYRDASGRARRLQQYRD